MRQWELIGITDQVASPPPPPPSRRFAGTETIRGAAPDRPVFLWNTDSALRLRTVTEAAAEVIGQSPSRCQGRDLIGLFGMEGTSLAILEAHVAALSGATVEFELHGARSTVRCTAVPTHDAADRITGTLCLAIEVEDVDVREAAERVLR
jgi:hypothetical protein